LSGLFFDTNLYAGSELVVPKYACHPCMVDCWESALTHPSKPGVITTPG